MVEALKVQNAQLQDAYSTISTSRDPKPKSTRAMIVAPDTDDSQLDESESDDDGSVDSHESSISSMANAALQTGLHKPKFNRRKGSFKSKH